MGATRYTKKSTLHKKLTKAQQKRSKEYRISAQYQPQPNIMSFTESIYDSRRNASPQIFPPQDKRRFGTFTNIETSLPNPDLIAETIQELAEEPYDEDEEEEELNNEKQLQLKKENSSSEPSKEEEVDFEEILDEIGSGLSESKVMSVQSDAETLVDGQKEEVHSNEIDPEEFKINKQEDDDDDEDEYILSQTTVLESVLDEPIQTMLSDPELSPYFKRFVERNFGTNELDFYQSVQDFAQQNTPQALAKLAKIIIDKFITPNLIDINDTTKQEIISVYQKQLTLPPTSFDKAIEEIKQKLKDKIPAFLKSEELDKKFQYALEQFLDNARKQKK